MLSGNAILFSEMTPDVAWEGEFNEWYDTHHIPIRMACGGFRSAQRFRNTAENSRSYLAVYELESLAALSTPAYQAVKQQPNSQTARMLGGVTGFTRFLCECIGDYLPAEVPGAVGAVSDLGLDSPYIYAVWFNVPEAELPDFDAWYTQDHIPLLLRCKDWVRVRRFNVVDGSPGRWNRLTIHHLTTPAALDSPERAEARVTPWRGRLAQRPWFKGEYQVFSRLGPRQVGMRFDVKVRESRNG